MLKINTDNVSIATIQSDGMKSGIILSDLTEERKKELTEQAKLFVSHTDVIGQQEGSLDSIHNSIQNIGKDFLAQTTKSSLNNDILKHAANLGSDDSVIGQTMKEYQNIIADLDYEENLMSKNPLVRTINRLPGAYFVRKKVNNFRIKLQNGQESIERLSKKVDREIKLVESYIHAMGQEHKNQTEDIKKSFEYIYYMTAVQAQYEKKIAVLRENNEGDYAQIIEDELLNPLLERQSDLKTVVLAKMMNVKALKQLRESSQIIIKKLVREQEMATPIIATTMINVIAAQQNERALKLIGSTRALTSDMIDNLTKTIRENQKNLHELSSSSVASVNDIIKAHKEFKQLEEENEKFKKERYSTNKKALEEINSALTLLSQTTEEYKVKEVNKAVHTATVLLDGNKNNNPETTSQTQTSLDMTKYENL